MLCTTFVGCATHVQLVLPVYHSIPALLEAVNDAFRFVANVTVSIRLRYR
jgi:hypothetical protein